MESSLPPLLVTCGLIWQGEQVLLVQRGPQQEHANQWEFPGGKIEVGETPHACLQRELREELTIEVAVGQAHPPVKRSLDNGRLLLLLPFDCQLVSGTLQLLEHQDQVWTTLKEALLLDLSPSDRIIVHRLTDW